MKAENLAFSRVHFPITSLGYGRRIALWTQGCSIGCKGCMSLDTWASRTANTSIDEIADRLGPWLVEADGLTISGGEPFDQPEAIVALLSLIRPRVTGDILLFSGYSFDDIHGTAKLALDYLDVLICGPFVEERASDLPLRGSENQEIRVLTPLGRERYGNLERRSPQALSIDLIETDGELWFAGIPRPGDLNRLDAILSARGLWFKTSTGRFGDRR
jgi:anaerobic ribonucleoside-triphosphate reductase activating protein